jgi:phosphoribosylaminoimidazole (AIR) synthetase
MTDAYAASGVDTEAGDLAVSLMKKAVSATHNDKVFGSLGGFAGAMDVSFLKSTTNHFLQPQPTESAPRLQLPKQSTSTTPSAKT